MSATNERYVVLYDAHPEVGGGPKFLTDSWISKRHGVPEFSQQFVRARKYESKDQAEHDALRYHPGSGYLPGRVLAAPSPESIQLLVGVVSG